MELWEKKSNKRKNIPKDPGPNLGPMYQCTKAKMPNETASATNILRRARDGSRPKAAASGSGCCCWRGSEGVDGPCVDIYWAKKVSQNRQGFFLVSYCSPPARWGWLDFIRGVCARALAPARSRAPPLLPPAPGQWAAPDLDPIYASSRLQWAVPGLASARLQWAAPDLDPIYASSRLQWAVPGLASARLQWAAPDLDHIYIL